MKIYYFTLLLVVFFSCSNEQITNSDESSIDMNKIESIQTMDEASQKIAFNHLNSKEKHYFRTLIITEFIENNSLSKEQLILIDELLNRFKSEVYENTDYAQYFKNIFVEDWVNRAKEHFTMNELFDIVTSSHQSSKNLTNINSSSQRYGGCHCHYEGTFGCKTQTRIEVGIHDVTYEETRVPCSSTLCLIPGEVNEDGVWEENDGGCGWFWLQKCDGTC